MTVQCCVCAKVRIEDKWQAVDHVAGTVSHTYCPACFETAKATID